MTPAARLVHLLHSSAKELEELSHDAQGRDELCKHLDQITEATFAMFIVRNRMNKRRLLKLADLLERDAANPSGIKFDLATVVEPAEDGYSQWRPAVDCGTVACAIGLWGLSGEFDGVSYGRDGWPTFNGKVGVEAAEEYFGIDEDEFGFLFLHHSYQGETTGAEGERAVAKRIRDFVAGKVAP